MVLIDSEHDLIDYFRLDVELSPTGSTQISWTTTGGARRKRVDEKWVKI